MSKLSGKCDLYDHVYIIGSRGTTNEMTKQEKFNIFKQRTNGILYQTIKTTANKNNIDFLISNNPNLKKLDNGHYLYFTQEYKSLKSLNKAGVYYTRKIYFDDMLDLLPYLSYTVVVMAVDENGEYIELSSYPYPYQEFLDLLECGYDRTDSLNYWNKKLKQEYLDTIFSQI